MQIIPTILAKTVTSSNVATVQNTNNDIAIWAIIAIILAIVGGILTYFLFVKSGKDVKSKKSKRIFRF